MKLCPRCKELAYQNSYFGVYYCPNCGWEEPIDPFNGCKGCGCCYSADWGQYEKGGRYRCPHRCLYCYAKA